MSQFLKKKSKLIYLLFFIFCFLFVLLACFYITPYSGIFVKFNDKFLQGAISSVETGNSALVNFCKNTVGNYVASTGETFASYKPMYEYLYNLTYDFNVQLQFVNNSILSLGAVSLVMVAIMFICSNHSRKKYYISNIVSGVACPLVCIVYSAIVLVLNLSCITTLNESLSDFQWVSIATDQEKYTQAIEWYNAGDLSHLTVNSTALVIYSGIIIAFIVACCALIAYNIFRYKETRKELLEVGE